jgi:hypothetical protein
MAPSIVNIQIETDYFILEDEYYVVGLIGSIPALGQWHVSKAVLAVQDPTQCGRWVVNLKIPTETTFEWKWCITNRQRSHVYR